MGKGLNIDVFHDGVFNVTLSGKGIPFLAIS